MMLDCGNSLRIDSVPWPLAIVSVVVFDCFDFPFRLLLGRIRTLNGRLIRIGTGRGAFAVKLVRVFNAILTFYLWMWNGRIAVSQTRVRHAQNYDSWIVPCLLKRFNEPSIRHNVKIQLGRHMVYSIHCHYWHWEWPSSRNDGRGS